MKKITISLIVIAVMAVLAFGFVYAVSDSAVAHSQACEHASDTGKAQSSDNSVLKSCSVCGDLICSPGETETSCPDDCHGGG